MAHGVRAIDLLKSLYDNKPIEKIKVPTSAPRHTVQAAGPPLEEDYEEDTFEEDEQYSSEYAKVYQEKETALYAEAVKQNAVREGTRQNVLSEVHGEDLVSSACYSEVQRIHLEELSIVFKKFDFNQTKNQMMTIDSYREHILSMINVNEVVIIQGPTGCGKTTQVPQFILDDCRTRNKLCNIVVTQPRRIAAISVARRVCEERGWSLGTVCGYQVGLERETSPDTVLTYVTTGVLLQRIVKQKNLHEYTHIIIDEVHERNQDMDFLLLVIRKFLFLNSPNIKVILMSATFETDEYANYFRNYSRTELIPAPVIFIRKPSIFKLTIHYLDHLKNILVAPETDIYKPAISKEMYEIFTFLVRALDRIDENIPDTDLKKIGSVLVFLPGIYEIEDAYKRLKENMTRVWLNHQNKCDDISWHIVPLHSSLTIEEQRKVFEKAPAGQRKIILSTNIAESSITVPDVDYVIDFCLTKTMVVDPHTKYQSLQLEWASHVNCTQRAGRVGRIHDGRVYRLVTERFYQQEMKENIVPEILRAPLDRVVLSSKLLDLNEPPEAILALALDPPNLKNIESTVWCLKEIGALSLKTKGRVLTIDGDLTFLGTVMANLPLDVNLSKLIVLGHMFSCLRDTIIMAAGCSLSSIFSTPFQERLKAYSNKLMWADGSCSDLIALLNLYKVWERNKRMNAFTGSGERDWIRQNYLSSRSLREWQILVKELTERLNRLGIRESVGQDRVTLSAIEAPLVLKIVMCGAFYPNYFVRSSDAGQVDEREAVKTLGGRDPYRTVYFTNMDNDQPGQLYVKSIKKFFPNAENMSVTFDKSRKVYVEFLNTDQLNTVNVGGFPTVMSMPGKIVQDVYLAIRRRQLGIRNYIDVLSVSEAWRRAKHLGIEEKESDPVKVLNSLDLEDRPVLPQLNDMYIKIKITERIDVGHFWAQNVDSNTEENLFILHKMLNNKVLEPVPPSVKIKIGDLYATQYLDDNLYYRCKVVGVTSVRRDVMVQVIFIDYGNRQLVEKSQLCLLPEEAKTRKPLAMECVLCNIQPSYVLNQRGIWSEEANKIFDRQTQGVALYGKVYSVVHGIVHLELFRSMTSQSRNTSLNDWLIAQGFAQSAEESFLSKENHAKREQVQQMEENTNPNAYCDTDNDMSRQELPDFEPPSVGECKERIELKGPFTPLEMHVFGIINSSLKKEVRIDSNSVNAVLLDTEPQDPHARLVVAAYMSQTADGSKLQLRNTTVMPNIHGLVSLMGLIFCPRMEPKPTANGTKIGAVLCGLGAYGESNRSFYTHHDMAIILDTELSEGELSMINDLRFWMNETVDTMKCLSGDVVRPQTSIEICQHELKTRLFGLLKLKRESIPRTYVKHANIWNKSVCQCEIMESERAPCAKDMDVWPMHWTVKLKEYQEGDLQIMQNLEQMGDMAMEMIPVSSDAKCILCNVPFLFVTDVRLHLISKEHKEAVEKAGIKPPT